MARTRFLALSATIAQIAFGCAPPPADSAYPDSCDAIRASSISATGKAPEDGIYTIYLLEDDPDGALDVYCQDMRRADPAEYLPVDPAHNFAWLKSGDETLLETRYERLRFDPARLELDLTDTTFATSSGTRRNLPPAWVHLPAGFAHYDATTLGGGLSAEASLDLTGTRLALGDEPAADPEFCRSSSSDQDIVALVHTGEAESSCDPIHCWSGTCTTGPATDAGVDDPPGDMAVAAPDAAQPDAAVAPPADGSVVSPPDAAVVAPADGSVVSPPDAAVVMPADGSVVTPPDATVVPPADGAVVAPPDAAVVAPPDAALSPPDAAPPALDCDTYCETVLDHCTGARAQFDSLAACLGFCRLIPEGTQDDQAGNTLGCRFNHAVLAAADPATECPNAGPSGGGLDPMGMGGTCGAPCEVICGVGAAVCPGQFGECMMICPFFGALASGHSSENTTRNDYGCRLNYLTRAAASPQDAQTFCPETGFASMSCSQ